MSALARKWLSTGDLSRLSGYSARHVRRTRLFDAWRIGRGTPHRFVDDQGLRKFCEWLRADEELRRELLADLARKLLDQILPENDDAEFRRFSEPVGENTKNEGLRRAWDFSRSVARKAIMIAAAEGRPREFREMFDELLKKELHPSDRRREAPKTSTSTRRRFTKPPSSLWNDEGDDLP